MKTYRWIFLVLMAGFFAGCGGDSEEELVGDWQRRALKEGSGVSYAASFVIGDKGYVACGYSGYRVQVKEVHAYDHIADVWSRMADFPGQGRQQAVGFSLTTGGKTYGFVGTGWDGDQTTLKDFWRYDPAKDRTNETSEIGPNYQYPDGEHPWEAIAPLPESADSRCGAIAFSLEKNGKMFGYVGFGFKDYPSKLYMLDLWEFDPEGETIDNGKILFGRWTKTVNATTKRSHAAVFIIDNKAYVCTGKNASANISDFSVFDGYSWDTRRPMNNVNQDEDFDDDYTALPRSAGVAYVVKVYGDEKRGHIVGGTSTNWEYDHVSDLWTQVTSFYNNQNGKQNRDGMISFSFQDGRAFVGLGKRGVEDCDDLWEFIPRIDDYIYDDYQ